MSGSNTVNATTGTDRESSSTTVVNYVANVNGNETTAQVWLNQLSQALLSFNSSSARIILQELQNMRKSSTDSVIIDTLLNDILQRGPDHPKTNWQFWTVWGPFSRVSQRARWASLQRTLDCMTPPPSVDDVDDENISATKIAKKHLFKTNDKENGDESQRRRRRRALVTVLRNLVTPIDEEEEEEDGSNNQQGSSMLQSHWAKVPAIRVLELKARRETQPFGTRPFWMRGLKQSRASLLERRPVGLETPAYIVLAPSDEAVRHRHRRQRQVPIGYEVRRYKPFAVCSVSMRAPRPVNAYQTTDVIVADPQLAGSRAFGALAGYLFGRNQQAQSMRMTTPVLTTPKGTTNDVFKTTRANVPDNVGLTTERVMSFVLPSEFWSDEDALAAAPQPLEGSGVMLERTMGGDRAVMMFGGYASKRNVEQQTQLLRNAIAKDPEWQAIPDQPVSLAQYNDPFTPPWKRLIEVSIPVRSRL